MCGGSSKADYEKIKKMADDIDYSDSPEITDEMFEKGHKISLKEGEVVINIVAKPPKDPFQNIEISEFMENGLVRIDPADFFISPVGILKRKIADIGDIIPIDGKKYVVEETNSPYFSRIRKIRRFL